MVGGYHHVLRFGIQAGEAVCAVVPAPLRVHQFHQRAGKEVDAAGGGLAADGDNTLAFARDDAVAAVFPVGGQ